MPEVGTPARRRTRLAPEARQAMILHAAIEFFAEKGFAAQTRELANRLHVSEPLIYRYFPTKDALIQRVYEEVIESRWDAAWTDGLRDRSTPLRTRMVDFAQRYLDAIDDPVWVRIVMWASLDGLDMTRQYISGHIHDVLAIIAEEAGDSLGLDQPLGREQAWHFQSSLIYYLIRKYIHKTWVTEDPAVFVEMTVDAFLAGLQGSAGDSAAVRRPGRATRRRVG